MSVARSGLGWLTAKYGTLLLSFGALMYFSRELRNPTYVLGLFQVFEAVLSVIMLITSSGLGSATVKRVSEGKDTEEFVGAVATISVTLLALVSVGVLIFSGYITSYFGAGLVVVSLLLVTIWSKQTANMATSVLAGTARVGRSGAVEFVEMFVRVLAQLALVVLGFEFVGLVVGATIGTVMAAATAIWMLPVGIAQPSGTHFRRLLSFTKYSFFQGFAGRMYNNVDTFVIAAFVGSSGVSLYNVPFRIALVFDAFSGAIHQSILPEISSLAEEDSTERIENVLGDAMMFSSILVLPATVGMLLLAKPIVVTFFTGAFAEGAKVAILAVAIQIPEGYRSVFQSTTLGLDRPDITLRSSLILVVANAILDIALVPIIGIEGAAVGTLVGATLATAYLGRKLFDLIDLSWDFVPFRPLLSQFLAAAVMAAVVHLLKDPLPLPAIPWLLTLVGVGAVVYWLVLLTISPGTRRRILGIVADVLPA